MNPRNFRILVALSLVLPLLASAVDLLFGAGVPEALREAQQAMEEESPPSALALQSAVAIALLVVVLAATWGLFMFRRWGRTLALVSCALAFAVWPYFGYGVYSGWAFGLMELGTTVWGAVIALSYASSVAAEFR